MIIRNLHLIVSVVVIFLEIVTLILAFMVIRNDLTIANQEVQRYQSYLLADELRQSSDDLTRMVRTYAVTSDPRYVHYFNEILDIRNGEAPRPENYHSIYWDFVVATHERPGAFTDPVPLRTLMQEAGFTDAEIALLQESEDESNDLVNLETEALNAMIGFYKDEFGNYTVRGEPNPELARMLLHSPEYHAAKERIMRPLQKFFKAIDDRTAQDLAAHHERERQLILGLATTTTLAILLALFSMTSFIVRMRRLMRLISSRIRRGSTPVREHTAGRQP